MINAFLDHKYKIFTHLYMLGCLKILNFLNFQFKLQFKEYFTYCSLHSGLKFFANVNTLTTCAPSCIREIT